MADPNNPGQFGNREDTEEMAKKAGESSHGRRSANQTSSAAGRTEAAARGGKHSRRRSR